jgi:hypothetical protein
MATNQSLLAFFMRHIAAMRANMVMAVTANTANTSRSVIIVIGTK